MNAWVACIVLATGCNQIWGNDPTDLLNQNPRLLLFDNLASTEDLVDFPVLLVLDSTRIDYDEVTDPTTQLRFHDPDTDTDLAFEIERWDPPRQSYLWVRVPKIDAASNTDRILMHYGADAAGIENPAGVWSSFDLVFHATRDRLASSVGSFPATATGVVAGEGVIADAVRFQNQSVVRFANTTNLLDGWEAFTIELWILADYTLASSPREPVAILSNGMSLPVGELERPDSSRLIPDPLLLTLEFFFTTSGTVPTRYSTIVPLQNWIYVVYTTNGQTFWTYSNGAFADADMSSVPRRLMPKNGTTFAIGTVANGFGMIDEVRISRSYREASWINAQYLSMTGKLVRFAVPGQR